MKTPFPYTTTHSAIAIAYKNSAYIADALLPRIPVGSKQFKYLTFPESETLTLTDTKVPRKGKPNEVEFSAQEVSDSCEDYGLDDIVPLDDIENAPEGYDPLNRAVESLTELILLDREVRVANLVFDPQSYTHQKSLSGKDQFSDFALSDPIETIMEALDTPLIRPNTMTLGRKAFSILSRHPKILKAVHGNSGDSGIASRQAIAELFELKAVLVGESFINTAKKGKSASLKRVWGNHLALTYTDALADTRSGFSFGYTAQYKNRVAGVKDHDAGLHGAKLVRVGESVKELICAKGAGFLLQDVVA